MGSGENTSDKVSSPLFLVKVFRFYYSAQEMTSFVLRREEDKYALVQQDWSTCKRVWFKMRLMKTGDVGAWGCGSLGTWEPGDVGAWGCGSLGTWEPGDMGAWGRGSLGTEAILMLLVFKCTHVSP